MPPELNQLKEQKSSKELAESTSQSGQTSPQTSQKGSQRSTKGQPSAPTKTQTEETQDEESKSKRGWDNYSCISNANLLCFLFSDKSVKSLVTQIRSAEQSFEKVLLTAELAQIVATGSALYH